MQKKCIYRKCGKLFTPKGQNQYYCSILCRLPKAKDIARAKYLIQKSLKKQFKEARKFTKRICLNCQKPFKSENKFHRICDTCKGKAEYGWEIEVYSIKGIGRAGTHKASS